MTKTTRQRVAGLPAAAHTYASGDDGLLPAGALVGLTVTVPGGGRTVLVGPDQVDLDAGCVTSWQISLGDGWITGVTWPTPEQAVDVATNPEMLATLSEYRDVRRREWAARQEAREMAERAEALLGDLAAAPCAGAGRRFRATTNGRTRRNTDAPSVCPVCRHVGTATTDRNGWATVPAHTRETTDS